MRTRILFLSLLSLAGLCLASIASAGLPQEIEEVNIGVKLPAEAPFALPATTSAGLTIHWQALAGPATVNGNTVTLSGGTGAVTLKATQAGDASYDPAPDRFVTFPVSPGGGFVVITSGDAHVAGIKTDGSLWTWGRNQDGQLGDGTTVDRAIPAAVPVEANASPWTNVACGASHTVALRADGTLWSWGKNADGQLGISNTTDKNFPTKIGVVSTWKGLACGTNHTAAWRADGTLWTWGDNSQGQLGDGTIGDRNAPVKIGLAQDWTHVSCGVSHTIGRRSGGSLWGWGGNVYGQVGDGSTTRRLAPVRIGTDSDWVEVGAGFYFSISRRSDGTLWAWGNNDSGQLGDGTRTSYKAPHEVGGHYTDWAAVNCGAGFVVARKSGGRMWAWGDNSAGQLGNQTTTDALLPIPILDGPWSSVTAGAACVLAVKNGSLWTWGTNDNQQLALPPSLIGVTRVPPAVRLPYPTPQSSQTPPAIVRHSLPFTGTVGSGLPAMLRVVSGPATVSPDGRSLNFTGEGSVEMEISHPGDLAWEAAEPQTFTVQVDGTGPVFTLAPASRTLQIATPQGNIVQFVAEATDAFSGPATVQCAPPSGTLFPPGLTQVTCTAKDALGNETDWQFDVFINRPPTFSLPMQSTVGRVPVHLTLAQLLAASTDPDAAPGSTMEIPSSTSFTGGYGNTVWDGMNFAYIAAAGYSGTATVTFPLNDAMGGVAQASFQIFVAPVPAVTEGGSTISLTGDGRPVVTFKSTAGLQSSIERSTDLLDWTGIKSELVPEDGIINFIDQQKFPQVFYRLRTMLPTPE